MDQSYSLTKMRVWNFNEITPSTGSNEFDRSIQTAYIWYSDNTTRPPVSGSVGGASPGAGWTMLESGLVTFDNRGQSDASYDGETINLQGISARHVLIDIETGYGDHFPLVGISEVQFFTGGAVAESTLDLTADLGELVEGANVLAIQGLNSGVSDNTFLVQPKLVAHLIPGAVGSTGPRISEVAPATEASFWFELANPGSLPLNLDGYSVTVTGDNGGMHSLNGHSIAAGGFLQLTEAELGFDAENNEKIFLYAPGQELADARRVTNRLRAISEAAPGEWLYPDVATPGATNLLAFENDIVINEIMYNHQPEKGEPFVEIDEEWIELYNRNGSESVDLTGWSIQGGVEFDFPAGTLIAPNEYLVVSNRQLALAAKFPGVSGKVIGNFSGRLSDRSDVVKLVDAQGNPADTVEIF